MQLVEEAVDGCWIGRHARMAASHDADIGSVYSPPTEEGVTIKASPLDKRQYVETVVDISAREEVRRLRCLLLTHITDLV